MGWVSLYHPVTGGLQESPEELVEHWTSDEYGWVRVPDDVNLADPDAVAALIAGSERAPMARARKRPAKPRRTTAAKKVAKSTPPDEPAPEPADTTPEV